MIRVKTLATYNLGPRPQHRRLLAVIDVSQSPVLKAKYDEYLEDGYEVLAQLTSIPALLALGEEDWDQEVASYFTVERVLPFSPTDSSGYRLVEGMGDDEFLSMNLREYASRRESLAANIRDVQTRLKASGDRASSSEKQQQFYDDSHLMNRLYAAIFSFEQSRSGDVPGTLLASLLSPKDDPRKISYAPDVPQTLSTKRRRYSSWSKFLGWIKQQKYKFYDFTDKEHERISYLVGTEFPENDDWSFEILRGPDVMSVFQRYDDKSPHTCMVGKDYPIMYADNPDKVGMLIVRRGGKFRARALFWTTDEGVGLLDRIYPSDGGAHVQAAIEWAKEHGYDWKPKQTYRTPTARNAIYHVTLKLRNSTLRNGYPYLDTFAYSNDDLAALYKQNPKEATVVFHNDTASGGRHVFSATDGSFKTHYACMATNRYFQSVDGDNLMQVLGSDPPQYLSKIAMRTIPEYSKYVNLRYTYDGETFHGVASPDMVFRDDHAGSYFHIKHRVMDWEGNPIFVGHSKKTKYGAYYHIHDSRMIEVGNKKVAPTELTDADKAEIERLKREREEAERNFRTWQEQVVEQHLQPEDLWFKEAILQQFRENYPEYNARIFAHVNANPLSYVSSLVSDIKDQYYFHAISNDKRAILKMLPNVKKHFSGAVLSDMKLVAAKTQRVEELVEAQVAGKTSYYRVLDTEADVRVEYLVVFASKRIVILDRRTKKPTAKEAAAAQAAEAPVEVVEL